MNVLLLLLHLHLLLLRRGRALRRALRRTLLLKADEAAHPAPLGCRRAIPLRGQDLRRVPVLPLVCVALAERSVRVVVVAPERVVVQVVHVLGREELLRTALLTRLGKLGLEGRREVRVTEARPRVERVLVGAAGHAALREQPGGPALHLPLAVRRRLADVFEGVGEAAVIVLRSTPSGRG